MPLKSEPFEIAITGNQPLLLLPLEIIQPFLEQNQKRVRVIASFEGKNFEFYGGFQKRHGNYYMMFGKRYQKTLNIFPNDYFQLQFFEDESKYGVVMPEELDAVLLSDYEAFQIFDGFTAGKKRGIIYMVSRYRNPQTRIDKALIICENLKSGVRNNLDLLKSF